MDQEQAKSFLKEIIQINSVNPPGNETAVAEKLKSLFDEHGIETELVEYDENRANLIAHLKGEKDGPILGFTGHMDVVPPGEIQRVSRTGRCDGLLRRFPIYPFKEGIPYRCIRARGNINRMSMSRLINT